ncbi:homoserine O-acetyltransferase [Marinospirillum sp.]|uniref:E22 family MetX-like putative esterase n=1 Tax=Marinospirillum sp. TaxID=2183934 RepID=UPI002870A720|nr:homoserine O-acetyltransferase [Marinospirillum sp.]MDR9467822.1 homoserine O-acetyltransferase [Marinospirillum sp.]
MLVEKKTFTIEGFKTFNGSFLPQVQIGWESWGQLNTRKDNAILVTHYFSGSSHAAGRYQETDPLPGYWDSLIGPGKPLDTDQYFVFSCDTLVNQEPFNPYVVTTGPASINPETDKPWGLDFPVVTIADFVNTQKALMESLGIERLHAVMGPSMGSLQALHWAAAYPEAVERMVSVIGMGEADAWTCLGLQQWAEPILADPNWQQGDYYASEPPLQGVLQTLMQINQQALSPELINRTFFQHHPMEAGPLESIREDYRMVKRFREECQERAKLADANHLLYLIRANQLFLAGQGSSLKEGLQKIQAKCLFLPATHDQLLPPYLARQTHENLLALGKSSNYQEINGSWGHLDGLYTITSQGELIRDFLAEK